MEAVSHNQNKVVHVFLGVQPFLKCREIEILLII